MTTPILSVPPLRGTSLAELNDWIAGLNHVLSVVHDQLATLNGDEGQSPKLDADLDMNGHQIVNVTDLHGPGPARDVVRIFPAALQWPQATTRYDIPGADTVSKSMVQTALAGLGANFNLLIGILQQFQRRTG